MTAGALAVLIITLGPVSGAHFNPAVTLANRLFGRMTTGDASVYVLAQVAGGALGAVVANVIFGRPAFELAGRIRDSGALWTSEVIATFGLVLVVFGLLRGGRSSLAPFAVGAYIGGAYFFTSSTSFANPAVTLARTLSDTFAGIDPTSVPAFMLAQLGGGALALGVIGVLYPDIERAAGDVVLPHRP